jgi:hypothetical protein
MPATGDDTETRGRGGGRGGASGYDFQDRYVALLLAELLVGARDPIVEVLWEKKALDADRRGKTEAVSVDDVIVSRQSGDWIFVQVKETAPGGRWSVKQFIQSDLAIQFWKHWKRREVDARSNTKLLLASGGNVRPLLDLVEAAARARTPAELLSKESSLQVVEDVRALAAALSVAPENPDLLAFLKATNARYLPEAPVLDEWIVQILLGLGEQAPKIADRLVRLVASSKHSGAKARSSYSRDSLLDDLIRDGVSKSSLVAAGLLPTVSSREPDFTRYLASLAAEYAELPELPGHTKNLSLGDVIPMTVTLPPKPGSPEATGTPQPRILDLPHAVAEERAWMLVGEGGEGKSTALRFLAHHFAIVWCEDWKSSDERAERHGTTPIPIYIALRPDRTSLREQIWAALQRPGFRCSRESLESWLVEQPLLFLLDRFEDSETGVMVEDLTQLMRLATNARLVVASRPLPSHVGCPWVQARLQPPSDFGVRSFLKTLLGQTKGTELFDVLAQNRLLDPFRRPLFARLLALSSPDLIARGRFTPGEMFRDVLEGRFLGTWESPSESRVEAELMRALLAHVASHMVATGMNVVDHATALRIGIEEAKRRGVAADTLKVELLLSRTLKHGLVNATEAGWQFWHASFRDYFAAVWLEGHASAMTIYTRSWQPRWHECLVFYFGVLRGDLLETRLKQLLRGLWIVIRLLLVNPSAGLSKRLILILRCLIQAREVRGSWRERFVQRLPLDMNRFFLDGFSVPVPYGVGDEPVDSHRYFCDLVGQLRIPEAFMYLARARCSLDIVAAGLLHDTDVGVIKRLAAYIAINVGDDGRARWEQIVVSHVLLRSSAPWCCASLQRAILEMDCAGRTRALRSLFHAVHMFGSEDGSEARNEMGSQWVPVLVEFALHDEDDGVRKESVALLKAFGDYEEDRGALPVAAHQALLRALSDSKPNVRERALAGLAYPALKKHLDIAWRLLDDPDIAVVFGALMHFGFGSSRKRFCRAVLKVLRRRAVAESGVKAVAEVIYRNLCVEHPEIRVPRRSIALLMSAVLCGQLNGYRLYAVRALDALRIEWTVPFLTRVLWSDDLEATRCAAFDALIGLMGMEARPLVVRALEDTGADVRFAAAAVCFRDTLGNDGFHAVTGPILFRLLGDTSNDVRRYAWFTLRKYGYVPEDWYPHQGSPVYLGPARATEKAS